MQKTVVKFNDKLFRKRVWSEYLVKQTRALEQYAKKELNEMARMHTFQNVTYNLQDSLVWGVFFEGRLRSYGMYGQGRATEASYLHAWSRTRRVEVHGRQLAEEFITTYTPESTNGWEVVWAAVAPYSIYLDPMAGTTRTNHFYVISQRYDEIKRTFGSKGRVRFVTIK